MQGWKCKVWMVWKVWITLGTAVRHGDWTVTGRRRPSPDDS